MGTSSSVRTRVARRLVVLFLLSAILPTTALAVVSWYHVTGYLETQARRRAYEDGKHFGLALVARLQQAERSLDRHLESAVAAGRGRGETRRLAKAALEEIADEVVVLEGDAWTRKDPTLPPWPPPTPEGLSRLEAGACLLVVSSGDGARRAWLVRQTLPAAGWLVAARLDTRFLFEESVTEWLAEGTEAIVHDQGGLVFSSTTRGIDVAAIEAGAEAGTAWEPGRQWLAGVFPLPLEHELGGGRWTVVATQPRTQVFAAATALRWQFAGVVACALLLVALLTLTQVRRQFTPLERLHEATERIGLRDFETPVVVDGRDEFADLGRWFNDMREQLRRQFHVLSAVGALDRAILSTFDTHRIVSVFLERLPAVVASSEVAVTVLDPSLGAPATSWRCVRNGHHRREPAGPDPVAVWRAGPREWRPCEPAGPRPSPVAAALMAGARVVLTVPMVVNGTLAGLITVARDRDEGFTAAERETVAQLAAQVAVALSNAALVARLDGLSRGALNALARAVDAKSKWTSGHSERVTELAVDLGRRLGLDTDALETLRRGGLLHDIGKIGVPAAILDKPGPLTREELQVMRQHPEVGAHILAAIPEFADVVPIVLQHHERFDGGGYPHGLRGTDISLAARIFAVADVFEALTSRRPYRQPLTTADALQVVRDGRGTHFDPAIADAFLALMAEAPGEATVEDLAS